MDLWRCADGVPAAGWSDREDGRVGLQQRAAPACDRGAGPTGRSVSLGLCVASGTPCGMHIVTSIAGTNTDAHFPADYNAFIMSWVHARLADP